VQEEYMLVGSRSGRKFRMGDRVRIKVVAANLEKRQLDYEWILTPANEPAEVEADAEKPKPKRKKRKATED
jgi:ribonuclease R